MNTVWKATWTDFPVHFLSKIFRHLSVNDLSRICNVTKKVHCLLVTPTSAFWKNGKLEIATPEASTSTFSRIITRNTSQLGLPIDLRFHQIQLLEKPNRLLRCIPIRIPVHLHQLTFEAWLCDGIVDKVIGSLGVRPYTLRSVSGSEWLQLSLNSPAVFKMIYKGMDLRFPILDARDCIGEIFGDPDNEDDFWFRIRCSSCNTIVVSVFISKQDIFPPYDLDRFFSWTKRCCRCLHYFPCCVTLKDRLCADCFSKVHINAL